MGHIIFVSSPYTFMGKDNVMKQKVEKERYDAVLKFTAQQMKLGKLIFSPIVHCHEAAVRHGLPTDFKYWKTYCNTMIDRSQEMYVLRLPGWADSAGVQAEIAHAEACRIPIKYMDFKEEPEMEPVIVRKSVVPTIDGFDIPRRDLTINEKRMLVSLERFTEYHLIVEKDFVDTHDCVVGITGFGKFILARKPHLRPAITEYMRYPTCTEKQFLEVYTDNGIDDDEFYTDFAAYINTNVNSKEIVNQILIQVAEYNG